jgi:N utilization substance protein A
MNLIDIKALHLLMEQIEEEKRIPKARLLEAVEQALAAAYKKDFGKRDQIIRCVLNPETGESEFSQVKTVVDDTLVWHPNEDGEAPELSEDDPRVKFNSERHIPLDTAKLMKSSSSVGDEIVFPLDDPEESFGRVAAQTAKQVIVQKLREAERHSISDEYHDKEGEIVTGVIQRYERGSVYIDLGRAIGIMGRDEGIPGEFYNPGKHIKVYLYRVDDSRGLALRLSRAHPEFLKKLFANESPEIANGVVEIKAIAREPGSKTKIAVASNDPSIDPVGACVGQKGVRVIAVSTELGGERVDIVPWSEDPAEFIANALAPSEPIELTLDEANMAAEVVVPTGQLSLAIGRGGQNARLAARLTGWKIDIIGDGSEPETDRRTNKNEQAAEFTITTEVTPESQTEPTIDDSPDTTDSPDETVALSEETVDAEIEAVDNETISEKVAEQ